MTHPSIAPRTIVSAGSIVNTEDKLLTGFWRDSFVHRRCLVPVSEWAEAEGEKGHKTRTWYGVPGMEVFAVAGLWRPTEEWGDAYTLVMVDGHIVREDLIGSPLEEDLHIWQRSCLVQRLLSEDGELQDQLAFAFETLVSICSRRDAHHVFPVHAKHPVDLPAAQRLDPARVQPLCTANFAN